MRSGSALLIGSTLIDLDSAHIVGRVEDALALASDFRVLVQGARYRHGFHGGLVWMRYATATESLRPVRRSD